MNCDSRGARNDVSFLLDRILLTDPCIPILESGCRCSGYNGRNNIAETVLRIYTLHARNVARTRNYGAAGFSSRPVSLGKRKRRSLLWSLILLRIVLFCREDSPDSAISGFRKIQLTPNYSIDFKIGKSLFLSCFIIFFLSLSQKKILTIMKIDINFEIKISITIAKTPFLSCNFYYIFLYLYKIYLYKKYYNFYYILLYFIYIS